MYGLVSSYSYTCVRSSWSCHSCCVCWTGWWLCLHRLYFSLFRHEASQRRTSQPKHCSAVFIRSKCLILWLSPLAEKNNSRFYLNNIPFPYLGVAWVCVWSPVFQQSEVLSNAAVRPAEPRLRPLPSIREPPRARAAAQSRLWTLQQSSASHWRYFIMCL